jgi:hypothetical protein
VLWIWKCQRVGPMFRSDGSLSVGFRMAAALTNFKMQAKCVHAEIADVVHINLTS